MKKIEINKEKPVDIETFITSEYFLGLSNKIYPFWLDSLKNIYENYPFEKKYSEVVISGSIGKGATTIMLISLLYELYLNLEKKNPQEEYGLSEDTEICFIIPTISKDFSNQTEFKYLNTIIKNSPYFKSKFIKRLNDTELNFINNLTIKILSHKADSLGTDVHSFIFDTASMFDSKKTNNKKEDIQDTYDNLRNRQLSRFGNNCGINFINGYPNSNSFFINKLENSKNDKNILVIDNIAIWDLYFLDEINTCETFQVCLGNETIPPFIVSEELDLTGEVINVPIRYLEMFQKDIIYAINRIAGRKIPYKFKQQ